MGGGIVFVPTNANNIRASLSRVELRDNAFGLLYAGTGTGSVRVAGTRHHHNGQLFRRRPSVAPAAGPLASFFFDRATITSNAGNGVQVDGTQGHVVLGRSMITFNNIGLNVSGGGTIWSYGNNHNNANLGGDGGPNAAMVPD